VTGPVRHQAPKDTSHHVARPDEFTAWLRSKVIEDSLGERHEREADRLAAQLDRPGTQAPDRHSLHRGHPRPPLLPPTRPGLHAIVRTGLGSEGAPLEHTTRAFFEARLGYDFSRVRIHTGAVAARTAHEIGAQAYTVGQDIVFGEGHFAPGTRAGWRLMAHELIHVTQPQPGIRVRRKPTDVPHFDPKKMTDAQKAQLRDALNEASGTFTDTLIKDLADRKLTAKEVEQVTTWRRQLAEALKKVTAMPNGEQREVRRRLLETAAATLNTDLGAKALAVHRNIRPNSIARLADPRPADKGQLELWRQETGEMSSARALLMSLVTSALYQRYKLKPEDLQTGEETTAEAAGGKTGATQPLTGAAPPDPTAPPRTLEDRQLLEDLFGALPDAADSPIGDEPQLLEEYKKLTPDQRQKFKDYLKSTYKPGATPQPLSDALKSFTSMNPADKEVMEVNKRLGEEDEAGQQPRLEGPVLLKLQKDAGQIKATKDKVKQIHANLARMKSSLKGGAPSSPDLGIQVFVNEMAMAGGLMLGAAEASPLVRQVVDVLMTELATAREKILEDFAEDLAISAALALVPVVGEVELAQAARLIKKYYDKFQALAKVYATAEKIADFIDTVRNLPDTYRRFVDTYHRVIEKIERAEALLATLDSPEDVEAKLEEAEQKLMDEFEVLLEGKFGDLLEKMYIPADTSPDALIDLIFGLPKGIEALGRMWDYYQSPDAKSDYAEEVLMIRGFEAGKRLYPFVGWLVAHIADAVNSLLSRGKAKNLADRLMPKSQRSGGKERTRGIFRRRNRKHVTIAPSALGPPLAAGAKRMQELMNADEPSRHWAPAWFRYAMRQDVNKLNAETARAKTTVEGEVEERVGSGRGSTKKRTKEQVPLPKFRLRFPLFGSRSKELKATLKLNPETELKADALSNDDLDLDKGEPYRGTPEKRQQALRDWLGDAGYQLTHDNNGALYIRLPGGKWETPTRSYLRFNSAGAIVKWKPARENNDWEAFKERVVSTSADLPEGYLLVGDARGDTGDKEDKSNTVQRKRGMAPVLWQLGLDKTQHLVKGPGEKQPEFLWTAKVTTTPENYDADAMLKRIFTKPGAYNVGDGNQAWWTNHIKRNRELQSRPRRLMGTLGYTVRARLAGDKLSGMSLPDMLPRDDKGHLVARRFDGQDTYANLLPMKRSLNQVGAWYQLEQTMAKSYIGAKHEPNEYVSFRLDLQYPNSETRRPSVFAVNWARKVAAKPKQPADTDRVLDKKATTHAFQND
jgi:hypothetical protein